jgi:hypothetical protein
MIRNADPANPGRDGTDADPANPGRDGTDADATNPAPANVKLNTTATVSVAPTQQRDRKDVMSPSLDV